MSVARPMMPPRASTSRTTVPLAIPPMAGLHDICPIVSRFWVSSSVRAAQAGGHGGGLGAGVATADDDDVEAIHGRRT